MSIHVYTPRPMNELREEMRAKAKSCGNVFEDIGLPNPKALLFLANMKLAYDSVLTERIPDEIRALVERLK